MLCHIYTVQVTVRAILNHLFSKSICTQYRVSSLSSRKELKDSKSPLLPRTEDGVHYFFFFFFCFSKHDGYYKSKPPVLFKPNFHSRYCIFGVLKTCNCFYFGKCYENELVLWHFKCLFVFVCLFFFFKNCIICKLILRLQNQTCSINTSEILVYFCFRINHNLKANRNLYFVHYMYPLLNCIGCCNKLTKEWHLVKIFFSMMCAFIVCWEFISIDVGFS